MLKKANLAKQGDKSCLDIINNETYQTKGKKSRNKAKNYMSKYTVPGNKVLNTIGTTGTIGNRRDIKRNVNSGMYKSSKKGKSSRSGVSSLRSGSSHSSRIRNINKYVSVFSNALPYGPRNEHSKRLTSKSKKIKKSGSRMNSSSMSVYNEQPSNLLKSNAKENFNNLSLNLY
jgi:hypothetical protein